MNKASRLAPLRRLVLSGSVALCLHSGILHAETNFWTNALSAADNTKGPYWTNPDHPGNWSRGVVPTATDDVVFQLPFVRPAFDFSVVPAAGILNTGRVVVLFDDAILLPPPLVANSLTFNADYILVTARDFLNPLIGTTYISQGLTLTSGRITVNEGTTASVGVPLFSGNGTLTKLGSGKLLVFGSMTGKVLVQQGTLGGNFTVEGDLRNQAKLSPGASPGKITINGGYRQTDSGSLEIEVASANNFDRVQVREKAKLDGELDVSLLSGYRPKKGQKFTFLTASGGVSGRFDDVDAPVWDNLTLRPFYDKHRVYLKTVINSFEALNGLTPNQRSVARNLDGLLADRRADDLLGHLYHRDFDALPVDLDKIAPEELTSIFTISTSLAQVQSLNVQRRTDDLRSGASGFNASGLAVNATGPGYNGPIQFRTGMAGPTGKETKEVKEIAPEENRWGAFLTGVGEWVDVDGDGNARGFDLTTGGFTLGLDYKVCPNFAIGVLAGYAGTGADLTQGGSVWVNGGKLGLYATFFQNPQPAAPSMPKDSKEVAPAPSPGGGFYVDVAAVGGYNGYDTKRSSIQGTARGSTEGGELNVLVGAGYDWKIGALSIGPTATFNYTLVGIDSYTEHGSLAPLKIASRSAESVRTAFGMKASYDMPLGGGMILKPEFRAAWQHEYGDSSYAVDANLASGAGGNFLVNGPEVGRDSLLLGAGFSLQFNERTATYVYYDGELGRERFERHALSGGVRVAF